MALELIIKKTECRRRKCNNRKENFPVSAHYYSEIKAKRLHNIIHIRPVEFNKKNRDELAGIVND
jgi:hypothetical protein